MNDRRFAISMHILTLLSKNEGEWLSSDFIASSININPVLVRKEISNLRKHHILISKEGKNGGSMLARQPQEIFISDIYKAVTSHTVLGNSLAAPNPKCPVGQQINERLYALGNEAEKILIGTLSTKTLAEFSAQFK